MVDRAEAHLDVAVSHADIVIIATPVMTMKDIFREIAGYLSPDSIVTDTGSTKAQVMKWAQEYLPPTVSFVGGHPMTGKETSGLGEAEARLLKDCVYCLTPAQSRAKSQESRVGGRGTPDSRLRTPDSTEVSRSMERLVKSVGARPLFIDAEMHDELVAGVSHLPILLSSALVSALARSPLWPQMSKLAATGYRDSTRLASGSPELNCGICLTNQSAIINWIDRYIEELKGFRRLVLESGPGLEESLQDARAIRQRWLENEGRRFNSRE
ncbi:MAG: Prephenate dehydrogenase [Dehalococcoidia bacterium]|nr:Prephenate dehydrogenase [Chloroflexota bacterium]